MVRFRASWSLEVCEGQRKPCLVIAGKLVFVQTENADYTDLTSVNCFDI